MNIKNILALLTVGALLSGCAVLLPAGPHRHQAVVTVAPSPIAVVAPPVVVVPTRPVVVQSYYLSPWRRYRPLHTTSHSHIHVHHKKVYKKVYKKRRR